MGRKVVTTYTCDLCGEAIPNYKAGYSMPVRFHTDQTEGRACAPYYSQVQIDLCSTCLKQVITVDAWGAMGHNTYELRRSRE